MSLEASSRTNIQGNLRRSWETHTNVSEDPQKESKIGDLDTTYAPVKIWHPYNLKSSWTTSSRVDQKINIE